MDGLSPMLAIAGAVVDDLIAAGETVATAESCTGGFIAKMLTDVDGSSRCFGYGVVSYSNDAKTKLLGVSPETLQQHGAVSEQVVAEMALGALRTSKADHSVAVSGIAGPDGGTEDKPVGTVWIAWGRRTDDGHTVDSRLDHFIGDRDDVRSQTVMAALEGLRDRIAANG